MLAVVCVDAAGKAGVAGAARALIGKASAIRAARTAFGIVVSKCSSPIAGGSRRASLKLASRGRGTDMRSGWSRPVLWFSAEPERMNGPCSGWGHERYADVGDGRGAGRRLDAGERQISLARQRQALRPQPRRDGGSATLARPPAPRPASTPGGLTDLIPATLRLAEADAEAAPVPDGGCRPPDPVADRDRSRRAAAGDRHPVPLRPCDPRGARYGSA